MQPRSPAGISLSRLKSPKTNEKPTGCLTPLLQKNFIKSRNFDGKQNHTSSIIEPILWTQRPNTAATNVKKGKTIAEILSPRPKVMDRLQSQLN